MATTKTAKPVSREEAWRRFLGELDRDKRAGKHARNWVDAGADLKRIFSLAGAGSNSRDSGEIESWEAAQYARGKAVKAGLKKAISGLEAVGKAAGEVAPRPGDALDQLLAQSWQIQIWQMLSILRERLANCGPAYTRKRPGHSQHGSPVSLVLLRQYVASVVGDVPSHDAILAVARCAAAAWGRETQFDSHVEALRRGLLRLEAGDPVLVAAARKVAGGSQ